MKRCGDGPQAMTGKPLGSLSDEQLMSRLARGGVEMLGELYERHEALVRAALSRFAPEISTAEIEELAQEVFLTVNDTAARFPKGAPIKGWLYRIAANKARGWRRKTWLRRRLLGENAEPGIGMALRTSASPARRAELRLAISRALASLPADQREVLVLRAVEGFRGEEIAEILEIGHETVRTRLFRARKKLLASLDAEALIEMLREEEP